MTLADISTIRDIDDARSAADAVAACYAYGDQILELVKSFMTANQLTSVKGERGSVVEQPRKAAVYRQPTWTDEETIAAARQQLGDDVEGYITNCLNRDLLLKNLTRSAEKRSTLKLMGFGFRPASTALVFKEIR